ncbi:MAG: hypothetical protein IJR07_04900 [Bacteroidaceae bacterium]|nr:hypothetical protein [Bacteroidaceae bacterium]
MNALDLNSISRFSPYRVWMEGSEYRFETDHGILYAVEFIEEPLFNDLHAYWFGLYNRSHVASPGDVKVRATVTCIIEGFFKANPDILLYMCDTADEQQAMRNRLFLRWFNAYARQHDYYIRSELVIDNGEENYIAIIVQRSHPDLQSIINLFDDVIRQFQENKP